MGRITRSPPKPKPKFVHEMRVSAVDADEPWIWEEAAHIGGLMGYKRRGRWPSIAVLFDTPEKAEEFRRRKELWQREREAARNRLRPCPIALKYEAAALGLHAVVWGLSTGIIRDVVQAYRRARYDCSSHGVANFAAALVIVERCRWLDTDAGRDRARNMAEHMLVYIEKRHRDWFWRGLEGEHHLYAFQFHK